MTDTHDKLREAVARALCELRIRTIRRHDTPTDELEAMLPSAINHVWREHLPQADAALALMQPEIDRCVAEERARLLERLREPTHEMVRRMNAACDTPDVQMAWVFPYIADMLAQFEKENSAMVSNNIGRPIQPHRSGHGAKPVEPEVKICKHGIKYGTCSRCEKENSHEQG
jgi:hypothetical protein